MDLSDNDKDLLADTFANINTRYFLGEKYDQAEFIEGVELWR